MSAFFRRLSKSKIGTGIIALGFLLIILGFIAADMGNVGTGSIGLGGGSTTLAEVGDKSVTGTEVDDAMQRRLQEVRQQNPDASYATILGEFDTILDAFIDQRALMAFAEKYGFHLSKRLIDAEIAQIPQTRGLNGQFSEQAYQGFLAQQRMTDAQVRDILGGSLLQRLLLTPVAANPRVPVGMATPYASMLLELREGEAATIPVEAFAAGLNPTDADLQRYYAANRGRYMVPEQRVLRIARIGPEQVANVVPTDQEIAAHYNANQATYADKDTRTLSQAVVPDRNAANGIAARAKAGGTLAAAAAPAGGNAAVTTAENQTRQDYASVAGEQAAAAAFSAAEGGVVGPFQSDFGWVVVKVESIARQPGKTLAEARGEIAQRLTADKRRQALEALVDQVQTVVDEGGNLLEAAAQAKLQVTTTPLIMGNGASRTDAAYRAPQALAPAINAGFEIAANDPPEIITLPNEQGYALVAPAEIVAAAPAPLASIRERVADDWITSQALVRARAAAQAIAAKAGRGMELAQAVREAGVSLPPVRPLRARRMEIAQASGVVPPPLQMLFSLAQGKSRMVAGPRNSGFFVVKTNRVVPGNALLQPGLISRMQGELQEPLSQEYASQFIAAVRNHVEVERNEDVIQAQKQRMAAGTN